MRKQKALEKDRAAIEAIIREHYLRPRLDGGKYHKKWTGRELLKIIRAKNLSIGNGEYWELLREGGRLERVQVP